MAAWDDKQIRGEAFSAVAEQYDRHRPAYPDELIDRAFMAAGLEPGHHVLEIGCGTGQLTESLLRRGVRVTAVEPGARLISQARHRLADAGEVKFIHGRLEDASLPRLQFRAVFSASAIHWIDPARGWRRLADAVGPGGWLGLISYFGVDASWSRQDQEALRDILAGVSSELTAEWPRYRDRHSLLAGAHERRGNISELWAWLGSYDVGRRYAAQLFGAARFHAIPIALEQAADELCGVLGTMSFWAQLCAAQRDALTAQVYALQGRLGRPIRSDVAACLAMATRS